MEDQRRRRRRLLGPVRRLAAGEVRLGRTGRRSGLLEGRRPRRAARPAAVAADPGEAARHRGEAVSLAIAANGVGAWFAIMFAFWNGHYFVPGAAFALGLGTLLLLPLVAIALARIEEIAAIAFGRGPRRLLAAAPPVRRLSRRRSRSTFRPIASRRKCSRRRSTRWRGSNTRISNASSSSTTRPIQLSGCRSRSTAARSASASSSSMPTTSSGYKAGALRLALAHTAADAEIIGVIDADYVVRAELAEGPGAGLRRSAGRHDPGAAGPPRRRPHRHAPRHERRICRLLRHRHGPAQRGQRHHRARHHVPDPPRRAR